MGCVSSLLFAKFIYYNIDTNEFIANGKITIYIVLTIMHV